MEFSPLQSRFIAVFYASEHRTSSGFWMLNGVLALLLGGVFSILLVVARTPAVQGVIPFKDFFHTALVVHVDLTVLAWFMCATCFLWSIAMKERALAIQKLACWMFLGGMLLMVASPFTVADAHPLMNNYVPILQVPMFFLALAILLTAMGMMALAVVWLVSPKDGWWGLLVFTSALVVVTSLVAGGMHYPQLDMARHPHDLYEALFWGGGHLLQLSHTHMLLLCWLVLASGCGLLLRLEGWRWFQPLLWLVTVSAPLALVWSLQMDVMGAEFRQFFTWHMALFGGGYVLPAALALLWAAYWHRSVLVASEEVLANAMLASVMLFLAGGAIALMIREVDVTIPAHYHGSIVGISIAMMGAMMAALPLMGGQAPQGRVARWQPWVYGGGQLLHITGLMVSGGYEVARKTTESYDALGAKIGMGIMGAGGGIAIIGGFMFFWVMLKYRPRKPSCAPSA